MKFIINDTVVYSPSEGLSLTTSKNVEFKLSVIADKLLLLLITFKGETVTKKDIHDYLWAECSLDISGASINNNISHLRRFFKDMGVSDFIVTTPKVGIGIRLEICIESIPEDIAVEEKENPAEIVVVEKRNKNITKWVLVFFTFLVLSCIVFLLLTRYSTSEYINNIGTVKGCKVFSLDTLSDTESSRLMTSVNGFVNTETVTCTDDEVIIASTQFKGHKYVRGNREFFAICEMKKNRLLACDNYYYLGGVG